MLRNLLVSSISRKKLLNDYNASLINTTLPNAIKGIVIKHNNCVEIYVNKSINNYKQYQVISLAIFKVDNWKCNHIDHSIDFITF